MSDAKQTPVALIIDDQADVREMISATLQYEGWRVLQAADGRQAMEILRAQPLDLVLVDLMMPGMSGIELCHKLTHDLHLGDLPVLLISGVSEGAKILNDFWEMPLRYKNFLRKPFSTDELIRCVKGLMPRFKSRYMAMPAQPATQPPASGAMRGQGVTPGGSERSGARGAGREDSAPASPPTPPPWLAPNPRDESSGSARPSGSAQPDPKAAAPPPAAPTPFRETATPLPSPSRPAGPRPTGELNALTVKHPGYRILVIDDEEDICMILKAGLGLFHTVEAAYNGMEGLERLEQFAPDFIIADINMPVMNGLETAEAIRRHPVYGRIPIFFLTGETDQSLPRKAFDVGGNLYLRKPVDPIRLLKNIDYFLEETELKPGQFQERAREMAEGQARARARAAARAAISTAVRILVIDFNIEHHRLLKTFLEAKGGGTARTPGGPFETLWTEDVSLALGNLARWEPDLILYNPRHPGMDGIAFGQTLALQKMAELQEIAFIGTRFYDVDVNYSRNHFHRGTIELDGNEETIMSKLGDAAKAARARLRPKQFSIEQLNSEEVERLRQLQATNARQARERETLRQRYSNIQEFIDKELKS